MKSNCIKYEKCPFCFGCRAYSTHDLDCQECAKEKKNICNTKKHRHDLINKMITKTKINVK